MTETTIKGFSAIDLQWKTNGVAKPWAGLGKSISNTYADVLIDDAPASRTWYCAIGATAYWPMKPKIPGPHRARAVTKVDLYVWEEVAFSYGKK